jgi:cation:H+ antiporter
LPELVTSLAAVRMGAFDLAVGNLFGSNAINMVIFAILDPINPTGPVLPSANPTHVLTALVSIILMAIAIAALVLRSRRIRFAQPASILILIGYLLGIGLVFWRSTTT